MGIRGDAGAPRQGRQLVGNALGDDEHEIVLLDDLGLHEGHILTGVDVERRVQHHEQGVAVALQLGSLVAFLEVLGQQRGQPHLGDDVIDLGPVGLVDDGDSETLVMTVQPVQGLPDPGTFGHGGLVSVGEPLDAHRPGSGDDVGCPVGQTISAAAGADPCDGTLTHFPVDLVHHAPPVGLAL